MDRRPDVALIITTFERPNHLRRCLFSIRQQRLEHRIEVVVTDDGSTDETPRIVEQFGKEVSFPVKFTTAPHTGFCVSRCRNRGVKASAAPYLLMLDGDCVLPKDHVAWHMTKRRPSVAVGGDCCRLDEESSEQVTESTIRSGEFMNLIPADERKRMAAQFRRARLYNLIRHPRKPKLIGNNIGLWRADYERINGYDENFVGWGCEDDDFGLRLKRAGVRIESILNRTFTVHLWHPVVPTNPAAWRDGQNVAYFCRKSQLTCCRNGMNSRENRDMKIRVVGTPPPEYEDLHAQIAPMDHGEQPEVEIIFWTGNERFSGRAEFNVLVNPTPSSASERLMRQADVVVGMRKPANDHVVYFPIDRFDEALRSVA